jgi:hypothetical protein
MGNQASNPFAEQAHWHRQPQKGSPEKSSDKKNGCWY